MYKSIVVYMGGIITDIDHAIPAFIISLTSSIVWIMDKNR